MADLEFSLTVNVGNISKEMLYLICNCDGLHRKVFSFNQCEINYLSLEKYVHDLRNMPAFDPKQRMCDEFLVNIYDDVSNANCGSPWKIETIMFNKEQSCPIPQQS
jgi:hypothetical protein